MIKSLIFSVVSANLLNYQDGYYVGAGLETSDASLVGSPFDPSTIVLKDKEVSMKGNIKMDVVQSEEEMAHVLTNKSPIDISLFGISAKVDLSFDKKYSMKSNSVVAIMSHDIRRSQTLLDMHALKLTESAKNLIKTDPVGFREIYGNAFIAGYTDGCSFDVKVER